MADENTEQVNLLFDYTKFHIGLYSTFASAVLALLAGTFADGWVICRTLLAWSLLPIAIAGLAGGVIASSLPHMFGIKDVRDEKIGPLWFENLGKLKSWTYLEHASFWLAFLIAAGALVVPLISTKCHCEGSTPPRQTHVVIDSPRVKERNDFVATDPGGGSGTAPSQPTTTTPTSTGTTPPTGTTTTTLGGGQPPITPPHPVPK